MVLKRPAALPGSGAEAPTGVRMSIRCPLDANRDQELGKGQEGPRDPIRLDKAAQEFSNGLENRVLEWLDTQEPSLDLPPANPFYRAVTYQLLESFGPEDPGFYVEKVSDGPMRR